MVPAPAAVDRRRLADDCAARAEPPGPAGVIGLLPVRAGQYREEGLATRAHGFYELDQERGVWRRIEGMGEVGGRWRLAAAEGDEVVIVDPRAGRIEWRRLPGRR